MDDSGEILNEQHLDMISGLQTDSGGNLAEELLDHITGEGRETFESLLNTVRTGDVETARKLAHRLKGMSSNLGMTRLSEYFRLVEERAKSGSTPVLSEDEVSDLKSLLEQSIGSYRAHIRQ